MAAHPMGIVPPRRRRLSAESRARPTGYQPIAGTILGTVAAPTPKTAPGKSEDRNQDPNTLFAADSRPEGRTLVCLEWENRNERLRFLAPVYFSPGSPALHLTSAN
jgi:hypothetical protein